MELAGDRFRDGFSIDARNQLGYVSAACLSPYRVAVVALRPCSFNDICTFAHVAAGGYGTPAISASIFSKCCR
jgi:hypothetical protein